MSSQRRNEIDRIIAAAQQLDRAERAAFLKENCGGDEQLRKEVDSLLDQVLTEHLAAGTGAVKAETIAQNNRPQMNADKRGSEPNFSSLA